MTAPDHNAEHAAQRSVDDDALLAEMTAPPTVNQAREAYLFWQQRLHALPTHKRTQRKEAEQMAARWKTRLAEAERDQYGPGLFEQLLSAIGVRRVPTLPSRRKIAVGLSLVALITIVVLIALIVAIVVFWSDLYPIVQTLLEGQGAGDG